MGKQYERHKKHIIPHCALMTVKGTALGSQMNRGRQPRFTLFWIFEPEPQILK